MKTSKHISESTGFKVPKSYFKDFDIKTLRAEKRAQKTGFSVPEAYFNDFEVKIPAEPQVLKITPKYKTIAIAASLLILLGSLLLGLILKPQSSEKLNFSKINKSEIENYIEYEIFMDTDAYDESDGDYFKLPSKHITENNIIDNMDDSSIEQLIEY